MRGAGLNRAAVADHGFDRVRALGARELLALGLLSVHDRHRHLGLGEVLVDGEHLARFFLRLFRRLVGGMSFLPEELRRAQEQTRDLLPSDDVRPLVDQDGQIAPRLHPLGVHGPDDGLGGRTDDEPLLEVFVAAASDPGDLRRKALDVLALLHQQAFGNEQRKIRVDVTGFLEPAVERLLYQLPDGVAVRTNHHTALHGRVVGELGFANDVEVPAAEVLGLRRDLGWEIWNVGGGHQL